MNPLTQARERAENPQPFEQQFPQQAALLGRIFANGFGVAIHVKTSGTVKFYGYTKAKR